MDERGNKKSGGLNARSIRGCWTCRLRRKKCDETRPSCATCASLVIQCDGYGVKPEWMDRGPLEKARALQLKQTISQSKQRRRKHSYSKVRPADHMQASGSNLESRMQLDVTDISSFLDSLEPPSFDMDLCYDTQSHELLPSNGGLENPEDILSADDQLLSSMSPISGNISTETVPPQQLDYIPSKVTRNSKMDLAAKKSPNFSPLRTVPQSITNGTMWNVGIDSSLEIYSLPNSRSPSSNSGSSEKISGEGGSEIPPELGSPTGSSPLTPIYSHGRAGKRPEDTNDADTEDMLFSHYWDEVFPIQFPLYHSLGRKSRGWLFSKLRRVKSAYHACLTLSQYHKNATCIQPKPKTDGEVLQGYNWHYNVALEQMRAVLSDLHSWKEESHLLCSLETLTCILILLFCEIYPGGTGNWQMHLHGASACLTVLLRAHSRTEDTTLAPKYSQQSKGSYVGGTFEDNGLISFHLGHFVAFDIMASVSTRSKLVLSLNHWEILRKGKFGIDIRTIMGCENWVMEILLDVMKLDAWKTNAQQAMKLSVVELANHGARIELQIRTNLAAMDKSSGTESSTKPLLSIVHAEITEIFALSATTYLHVVLSGACPEVPEIIESVGKTIEAFRNFTAMEFFPRLSWCFCITGCLAREPQHSYLREIFRAAELDEWSAGTCSQALEIMEQCWETRKDSPFCDWVSAMDKQGRYSLFF